ncbi:MAG: peptidoglycan DD-metalloendopeptidase family protein [bacterium]|nr:peptidoglycan DD-metalloendopeptidase family protein [bacterium]
MDKLKQPTNLSQILSNHAKSYAPVISGEFSQKQPFVFDFTKNNLDLKRVDITDIKAFENYVGLTLKKVGQKWGIGGYGENRVLYLSNLFLDRDEPRTVHLATDLWLPSGTKVYSPLSAKVHSFQDNNNPLDYGPTIILEHVLSGIKFYTLYGHLSRSSLKNIKVGMKIKKGQQVATLGNSMENGQWPPHLHFQVISDMLGKRGDFPGVARLSEKDYYLSICPDPNLILKISDKQKKRK